MIKKNPNEKSGFKVFQWIQLHLLIKKTKGNRQREPIDI
jgi:hypothetical protein